MNKERILEALATIRQFSVCQLLFPVRYALDTIEHEVTNQLTETKLCGAVRQYQINTASKDDSTGSFSLVTAICDRACHTDKKHWDSKKQLAWTDQ
jgi:hypothetical protein